MSLRIGLNVAGSVQYLTRIAAEAGAADPDGLGRQLAVLYEGATALATSCDDIQPVSDAKTAAAALVQAALYPAPGALTGLPPEAQDPRAPAAR